jgi:predicted ATP-grasp superfamily ATP-dependent carboligase
MTEIILTDPLSRKTFDLYNYLIHCVDEYEVTVIGPKENSWKLFYSKARCLMYSRNNISDLLMELNSHSQNAVLLPVEESTIEILYKNKDSWSNLHAVIPSEKDFELLRNKKKLAEYCENNNISVPLSLSNGIKLSCDAIVKPIVGSGSRGIRRVAKDGKLQFNPNVELAQEIIPTNSSLEGFFGLVVSGKILTWHTHKRLRTWPRQGGVSLHSVSGMNKDLFNHAQLLLGQLNYSGLVMIEYMRDSRDNSYKLIEVNPRTWGSIMLSEHSGVHIIKNYVNSCLKKPLLKSRFEPKEIRWIFPFDVLQIKPILRVLFKRSNETFFIGFTNSSILKSILFVIFIAYNKLRK